MHSIHASHASAMRVPPPVMPTGRVRFAARHSPDASPPPSAAGVPDRLPGFKALLARTPLGRFLSPTPANPEAAPASSTGKPTADGLLTVYPPIEPFRTRMLQVSPLHQIYVEESGNPNGFPVIFLHGGPAAGLGERYRRFFNPEFFHIIGFDQRGCEKSTPLGELRENTTWDLVEDIQRIRQAVGVADKRYLIFGGSWGSLLALAAAEKHPEDVAGLIIRGISLGRPEDTAWSTLPGQGVYKMYPEAGDYWAEGMKGQTPDPEDIAAGRDPALGIYDRLFNDPDVSEEARLRAVKYWRLGSSYVPGTSLARKEAEKPLADYAENLHTARIVCRYYYQNAFMNPPDQLLRDVHRLKNIPQITVINGRDDLQTPANRAHELHKAMREAGVDQATLEIVEGAGHSAWNPRITHVLMQALHAFEAANQEATD